VDTQAVGGKIREGVQKRLGEEIQKIFPKDQQTQQPGTEQTKPGARDLLEGIFGKPKP
jgi:hypothetical protein